uniref:Uncharacterized protein n=1 Tax=Candidatus Methanogaster sp. ANME-2c ERB4 TaxID=2759911 RepID=A0A7G9YE91_9EURY|nr:hypothetical protein PABHDKJJ_00029 [Methanosarcinales archaeon ANME-2c ERB4]
MKTISIVIQTMKDMHLTGQRMGSIVGLAGHAGVAELVSGHSGDRTAGIAERCGVRHGPHTRDRVARYVSVHVLLWRRVVIGLVAFPAWFVCALYLLMAGRRARGFVGGGTWRGDRWDVVVKWTY